MNKVAMTKFRYWRITAGRRGTLAVDWLQQDIISVGWANTIGDFRDKTASEIVELDKQAGARRQAARFLGMTNKGDGMQEGDVVLVYAPDPKKIVLGVGVVGKPEYVENPDLPYDDHRYHRSVTWKDWGTPIKKNDMPSDSPQVYTRGTLVEYHGSRGDLEGAIRGTNEIPTEEIDRVLGLGSNEDDMHLWVMRNLQKLSQDISVTEHESSVSVGDIDILANDSNGWVVIEVKKGEAGNSAMGQVKAYMNNLRNETDKDVRGIVIAEDFSAQAKQLQNEEDLDLYRLKLDPSLESL